MKRSKKYFFLAFLLLVVGLFNESFYLALLGKSGEQAKQARAKYQDVVAARQDLLNSLVVLTEPPRELIPPDRPVYVEGLLTNHESVNGYPVDEEVGVNLKPSTTMFRGPHSPAITRLTYRYDGKTWQELKEEAEDLVGFPVMLAGVEVPWEGGFNQSIPALLDLELTERHGLPEPYSTWERKTIEDMDSYESQSVVLSQYPSSPTEGDLRFVYLEVPDTRIGALGAVQAGRLVPFAPPPPLDQIYDAKLRILAMIGKTAASQLQGFDGGDYTFDPKATLGHLLKAPERSNEAFSEAHDQLFGWTSWVLLLLSILAASRGAILHRREKSEATPPQL